MRARIRGIYTTALTKLLLEKGFQIVQPSQSIKTRFSIQENNEPPDINIRDRRGLQGVVALGTPDAMLRFKSALQSTLEDVLIREWSVSVDGIYKGRIVNRDKNNIYVDLGGTVGALPKHEDPGVDQREVVVQVKRRGIGGKIPILTTKIKFIGEYAILVPGGKIGVSLKIRDVNKRTELIALGKSLQIDDWGIIWRGTAALKPREALELEVSRLAEKSKILSDRTSSASAPTLLVDGLRFADIEFPASSKYALDRLRSTVTITMDGHHFYKSCGGQVSAALEMAEKLLEKGKNEVQGLFRRYIESEFPTVGFTVNVEHVKPGGAVFNLGQATIEALNAEGIRYSRTIRTDGVYDGLGVEKKKGDRAVSEAKFGEWYLITSYFSSEGMWKGAYVNINTPVELYPKAIRYVDLEVDVCVRPDGDVTVLDMEKLDKAYSRGIIGDKLIGRIKETLNTVTSRDYIQKLLAKFI
ncbi:MAG: DUF402 domain-containing protein [Candidatus Bathyarchaeota archaeon]|nr:DUF402 domain-containing protein [Candidatus Bathyarchaeota archaeon]MCX8177349.1 DUF402 domain-containing protein [Candidatus Bathyarchaeota archaeon]MDW8193795.1 DUF402 domain-containing protein [Nitrososphaerota archaeon]